MCLALTLISILISFTIVKLVGYAKEEPKKEKNKPNKLKNINIDELKNRYKVERDNYFKDKEKRYEKS